MRKLQDILEGILDNDFDVDVANIVAQALYNAMNGSNIGTEVPEILKHYKEIKSSDAPRKIQESPIIVLYNLTHSSMGSNWVLHFIYKDHGHYERMTMNKRDSERQCWFAEYVEKTIPIFDRIKNSEKYGVKETYRCWLVPQDQFNTMIKYYEKLK